MSSGRSGRFVVGLQCPRGLPKRWKVVCSLASAPAQVCDAARSWQLAVNQSLDQRCHCNAIFTLVSSKEASATTGTATGGAPPQPAAAGRAAGQCHRPCCWWLADEGKTCWRAHPPDRKPATHRAP